MKLPWKSGKKPTENEMNSDLRVNMPVEVMTPANRRIFLGRIEKYDGKSVQIAERTGQEVPAVLYDSEIKLRCLTPDGKNVIVLGRISGSSAQFWRLEQLTTQTMPEVRNYFRQQFTTEAVVMRANESSSADGEGSNAIPCSIRDISGGGVLLSCEKQYEKGDILFLSDLVLIPGEKPFSCTCVVCRASPDAQPPTYGCEFRGLGDLERDRLLRSIFTIQRNELQNQRGSSSMIR